MLAAFRWLLRLYPVSYRDEFGEEMTSVFREARSELPPALLVKISFYQREFCGVLSNALRAHFDRLFGPNIPFRRFSMKTQFRFPRSTVVLMIVIFAAVVVAISKGNTIAGGASGLALQTLVSSFLFLLLSASAVAAVVWGILHMRRRSGLHRLQNLRGN
jgi:hypothetical protein